MTFKFFFHSNRWECSCAWVRLINNVICLQRAFKSLLINFVLFTKSLIAIKGGTHFLIFSALSVWNSVPECFERSFSEPLSQMKTSSTWTWPISLLWNIPLCGIICTTTRCEFSPEENWFRLSVEMLDCNHDFYNQRIKLHTSTLESRLV